MPLLNKASLSIYKTCSKEESRFTLNGILVDPEYTVATDGHAMTICETVKDSAESYPEWESFKATNEWKPFVLPSSDCADIIKALPTKTTIPILANAAVGDRSDDSSAIIGVTDLDKKRVFEAKQDSSRNFPDWRRVLPKEENFRFEINVTAELLINQLQIHKEKLVKGDGHKTAVVTLKFQDKNSAFVITSNTEQNMTSVVMPCRGDGTVPVLEVAAHPPAKESPRFIAREIIRAVYGAADAGGIQSILDSATLEDEVTGLISEGL